MIRILKRTFVLIVLGALAPAVAAAAAAGPATPRAAAPGSPAAGTLALYLPDIFVVRGEPVTVPERVVHVDGVVRPYVPGQRVTIKAFLGRRLIKQDRLRIKPSRKGATGAFSEALRSPRAGSVVVEVIHERTSALTGFSARRRFTALSPSAGFGARSRFVQLIQQRLAALRFYIPGTGVYDSGTGLALDAYHRLLGWGTYQTLDARTISYLLNGWGQFKVRYPTHGRHAEGNLGKQVLALIDGSKVDLIFPISSGKPSTPTILGDFHVYIRDPGYLPDGMYYSDFFTGGYAIHGYDPAPDYPASHGCMRLPIPDAITTFNWLAIGDWVDVYY